MDSNDGTQLWGLMEPIAMKWLEVHPRVTDETVAALAAFALDQALAPSGEVTAFADRVASRTRRRAGQMVQGLPAADTATLATIALSVAACYVARQQGAGRAELAMELFGRAADYAPDYYDEHRQEIAALIRDPRPLPAPEAASPPIPAADQPSLPQEIAQLEGRVSRLEARPPVVYNQDFHASGASVFNDSTVNNQ
jgi:hypothetical protein